MPKKYKLYKIDYSNMCGGGNGNDINLYLFKADWCGHCKHFKPIWENLQNFNSNINYITYDADIDKNEIKKYKIDGYPTLILVVNNNATEYQGPRTQKAIEHFLQKYIKV